MPVIKGKTEKTEKCPASTDPAYLTTNLVLWVIGATGMYWFTNEFYLSLVMPAAYVVFCVAFFTKIYPYVTCKYCVYNKPDTKSIKEYLNESKEKFQRGWKIHITTWAIGGWGWPITAMGITLFVFGRFIVLPYLLLFLIISFLVFFPVLLKRVCPKCKVYELGICPMHPGKKS